VAVRFVLVHGSYLGAWSWELVQRELESAGHHVTAVDLPISDPAAGADEYARRVIDAEAWHEPSVVVGHSMAGVVIPLVASRVPVQSMIFVAAYLPLPAMSVTDQRLAERVDASWQTASSDWHDLGSGVWSVGPATARELFFHDAPTDVADSAIARLRPQAFRVISELTPLSVWPDTDSHYVVARHDRVLSPAWGRKASRDRLNRPALEIEGGHCPQLSRPRELAEMLIGLAG